MIYVYASSLLVTHDFYKWYWEKRWIVLNIIAHHTILQPKTPWDSECLLTTFCYHHVWCHNSEIKKIGDWLGKWAGQHMPPHNCSNVQQLVRMTRKPTGDTFQSVVQAKCQGHGNKGQEDLETNKNWKTRIDKNWINKMSTWTTPREVS